MQHLLTSLKVVYCMLYIIPPIDKINIEKAVLDGIDAEPEHRIGPTGVLMAEPPGSTTRVTMLIPKTVCMKTAVSLRQTEWKARKVSVSELLCCVLPWP